MEKEPNPRKQLKINIFETYRNCINAPSPDDLSKHKGQLWISINKWCKCLFAEEWEKEAVEEMVAYIPDVIDELVKEDRTIKTFEELDEFFMYLNSCLENKKIEILEKQLPTGVSKTRVKKYFYINKLIEIKKRDEDGKLTENERKEIITCFLTESEYTETKNQLYHLSLDCEYGSDDEDDKINLSIFSNVKSVFNNDPEITNKFGVSPEDIQEAVTYVLENKRQKKTRACNRALFTQLCIKEAPDYLDKLAPVLDSELLNAYRESNIKPTQYETYLKYHPERKDSSKNSIEVSASNDLDNFLNDLRIYLEEKFF